MIIFRLPPGRFSPVHQPSQRTLARCEGCLELDSLLECWFVVYIYIHIPGTPTDLYFWRSTPQSKAFSDENKGHLGSRYVSTLFTYLCVCFEFLFWLFSGDGCSATNFVLDNSTWIIHTPNSPKTIFSIHLRTWRCPAAKGKSSTIRFWFPMLAFRSFVDPHAEKKAFHGLSCGPTSVVDTARSGPESCQFHSSGVGAAQISKRWWSWVMWWWNLAWLFVCLARSFAGGSLSFRCEMLVVLIVKVVLLVYLPQCTFDFQEYLDECRTAKLFVALMAEDPFKYYTDSESCRICKVTITQMHSTFLLSFVSLQESSVCTTGQTCWWSQMMPRWSVLGSKLRLFPCFIGQ